MNKTPLKSFKPDLRAAKFFRLQKGIIIRSLRIVTLVIFDVISLVFAWKTALFLGTDAQSPWTEKPSFVLINTTVQISIFTAIKLYKQGSSRRNYVGIVKAVSLSILILLLIAFLYEPNRYISRSSFLLFWLLSIICICISRYLIDAITSFIRTCGKLRHPVFLISDKQDEKYHTKLVEKEKAYKVLRIADSSCLDLANREATFEYIRHLGITEAFISWDAIKRRQYVCWHFQTAGIHIRILPTQEEYHHPKSEFTWIDNVLCPKISAPMFVGADFWLKRCFDLIFSAILIFLLAPVYLLIAILIKLDSPGCIFFCQKRVGLSGKEFKIWKFRTMIADADKIQAKLEAKNEIKDGVLFKLKDDPRITRIGKFLRRYSLDELPQLFNVIVGEMSLVGPRPLPIRDVERFQNHHFIRQEVLPGITGLWQVSGRSNIDKFEDAVKLDIHYIENWSIWLDLQILFKTVSVVLLKSGAY
ncbi:sugar transferase [Calothrix sp. UHCC 0171]|uniref:sugar transferase n=1 Tax=Calothrix sp. UHCC 0171 TaxID=3110245 RepID=UPI002B213156|nr:sugar transferase [Calothrix sp. UHCC 0171]MEA5573197.1 sugar transferase [Calothrix sp. UHCC 0171]